MALSIHLKSIKYTKDFKDDLGPVFLIMIKIKNNSEVKDDVYFTDYHLIKPSGEQFKAAGHEIGTFDGGVILPNSFVVTNILFPAKNIGRIPKGSRILIETGSGDLEATINLENSVFGKPFINSIFKHIIKFLKLFSKWVNLQKYVVPIEYD